MVDWNALAEKHKLGTTDLDRTMALVCRELAGLVPQEVAEPSEPVVGAPSSLPKAPDVVLTTVTDNSATWNTLEGDEAK